MHLIRPNGMIERLKAAERPGGTVGGYGRTPPGPATPEALQIAARQDRRRKRRRRPDPLPGRLVDVTA